MTVGKSLQTTSRIKSGNVVFCSSRTDASGSFFTFSDGFRVRYSTCFKLRGIELMLSTSQMLPASFLAKYSALLGPHCMAFSATFCLVLSFDWIWGIFEEVRFPCFLTVNFDGSPSKLFENHFSMSLPNSIDTIVLWYDVYEEHVYVLLLTITSELAWVLTFSSSATFPSSSLVMV